MQDKQKKIGLKRSVSKSLLMNNLIWTAITGIVSLFAVIIVLQLWNRDLHVPFEYTSDSLSSLAEIKKLSSGLGIFDSGNMGAPFFETQYSIQMGFLLHLFIIKFIALFSNQFGSVVNLFYIMTYPMIAISCFTVLRKLHVCSIIAAQGGVLYSCLPYHFFRGQIHLYLSAYYMIPLACLVIFWLFNGDLCPVEYGELQKLSRKQLIKSIKTKKMLFSILICFLVGISDTYYSVFLFIILLFAMLFAVLETHKRRHLLYGGLLIFSLSVALLIIFLPSIIYGIFNERNILYLTGRKLGELEIYGLRITQLLLPIQGHRINFLAKIRETYDSGATYINENSDASLGFVMVIGFVCSLFAVFFRTVADKYHKNLNKFGEINLFIVLVSTVGGLNIFVGMFLTSDIRCYNRMCVFIAMFSIMAICTILDVLYNKIKSAGIRKLACLGCAALMVVGVADQTSASFASKVSHDSSNNTFRMTVKETKQEFLSDESFVQAIESTVENGAMVLELPIVAHSVINVFTNGAEGAYDFYKPALHAVKTKWSYGGILYGESDTWLYSISNFSIEEILDSACVMGFSGIYIDPRGYDQDELGLVVSYLETMTGEDPIRSNVKELYFFNIKDYAKRLRAKYSDEEWQAKKKYNEKLDESCYSSFNIAIHFQGESRREGDSMVLLPGTLQYGPYAILTAGTYQITVSGQNLDTATVFCQADAGKQRVNLQIIETSDTKIVYQISLAANTEQVEFCLQNTSNSKMSFSRVYCENINTSQVVGQ